MKLPKTILLLQPNCFATWSYEVNEHQQILCRGLNLLQQAIAESSYQSTLAIVDEAFETLGSVEIIDSEEIHTTKSLEPWEIEDYDNFFGLMHIQARYPPKCLVTSLLTVYQVWLELNRKTLIESVELAKELKTQQIGFKNCVNLLAKSSILSLEEIP